MAYVMAKAAAPPIVTRAMERGIGLPPMYAPTPPVMANAMSEAATVAGMRQSTGESKTVANGRAAPTRNEMAEDIAACHGFVS